MECKKLENLKTCNCTYPCQRRGLCCECVRYHRGRKELPACYFPKDVEGTYDRSISRYIECGC